MAGKPFELVFEKQQVNIERLHEDLAARFMSFLGVSTGPGVMLRLYFQTPLLPGEELEAGTMVDLHDPAVLTDRQIKAQNQQALLDQLRAIPWAAWTSQEKDDLLRVVAAQMGIDSFADGAAGGK